MSNASVLLRYARRALELPPHVVLAKGSRRIASAWRTRRQRSRDAVRSTYLPTPKQPAALSAVFAMPDAAQLSPHAPVLAELAALYLEHRHDLLGSGWTRVFHGMRCDGVEGHVFEPAPSVTTDPDGAWLQGRIPPACMAEARRIWRQVTPGYTPIDWHVDFKSGFRWSPLTWYLDVRAYGNPRGTDIKVPWELARCQHLPQLALAHALANADARPRLFTEFRNQVLDFLATNPPRWGVNWACAMDVAIRVANWIAAYDLFRSGGAAIDDAFAGAFARAVREHARHVADNLEWTEGVRSNHYLADICGLLIAAAALPAAADTDTWLAFALQELARETIAQFNEEGSNIEASTSYHRLSGEMVVYATAAALGLSEERVRRLGEVRATALPCGARLDGPPSCLRVGRVEFERAHAARIARMAAFTRDISTSAGTVPQIGDNDSGRFLKVPGTYAAGVTPPLQDDLDHRHFVSAVRGLLNDEAVSTGDPRAIDSAIVRGMARGRRLDLADDADHAGGDLPERSLERLLSEIDAVASPHSRRYVFSAPGAGLLRELRIAAYPQFGLYVATSARLHLVFRCGTLHAGGSGGHAHNDQLTVEICIDGKVLVCDPGTYLYTPLPDARNRYRSVAAHFAPQVEGAEPADLTQGLFVLSDRAQATCLACGPEGFAGEHHGYGSRVVRAVRLADDHVEIRDASFGAPLVDLSHAMTPRVSPAYGRLAQ